MKNIKQLTTPIITLICLGVSFLIPEIRYYWIEPLETLTVDSGLLFIGLFILITLIGISLIARYLGKDIIVFEKHPVVEGLKSGNKFSVWLIFPITMVFEEILFRGFLLGGISYIPELGNSWISIILSAVIFSLYHIHTWFTFKNKKVTLTFMSFSLVLGLCCGYYLFKVGIFGAILLHWFSVFLIFQDISSKIDREKPKEKNVEVEVNYSKDYLSFTAILAGLSFTLLFEFLGRLSSSPIDSLLIILFTLSSALFLIGTAGYADCSKIKNGKIRRQLPGGKWEFINVDFYKSIHLPDQFTLFGFLIMMVALAISGFKDVDKAWWGLVTICIVIMALLFIFKKLPSHGIQKE